MHDAKIIIPSDLFPKVMKSIYSERKRLAACRRFAVASIVFFTALASLYPVWSSLHTEFAASGFSQFLSLLVWDSRSVFANWQDYGLSLLESFPIINTAILLTVILSILLSIKFIAKNMGSLRRLKPAHN
jgi:ABC-type phosphate/phosphonate transport system permease subunit